MDIKKKATSMVTGVGYDRKMEDLLLTVKSAVLLIIVG